MSSIIARAAAGAALVAIGAVSAGAQANLSVQGFGFPTGQFSSRAEGAGGAIGELDPLSMTNPATIASLGSRLLFFQIEPEYRTVSTGTGTDKTHMSRFPVVFGALPIGSKWVMSFGSSTLLDRTSTTTFNTTQVFPAGDSAALTTTYAISGAMNDVRLATAWKPVSWLQLGVGAHGITGHNLVTITQAFVDTVTFSPAAQARVLGFSGTAASAGLEILAKNFNASLSGRLGGPLNMESSDTILTRARVPNRFGASVGFVGQGSTLAIRTSHDDWSSLGTLGTPNLRAVDTWDTSIGADVAGPRFSNRTLFLRGGFRDRTLPFQTNGQTVTEKSISTGLGTTFANGRVIGDFALIHADRSANLAATEHAWTLSFGISVLP